MATLKMKISILPLLFFLFEIPTAFADLQVGFYGSTCPKAETIIQQVVQKQFSSDRSLTAALVRLHFHDCFVSGCDASLLIDPIDENGSEKNASDSLFLRGFKEIDEIKESVEAACPSTVSCADIIALATRDAVALAGGPKYQVPTGRRDGLVSNLSDVNLPQPDFAVDEALEFFTARNLTATDMVILLGAHTVGVAHCGFFVDRVRGPNNESDATLDPALKAKLDKLCSSDSEATAFLDQNTSFVFDNQFYNQILQKRGVLQLDQQLALDNSTKTIVSQFAIDNVGFEERFANAIIKMGLVQVLVGKDGEIRKNCRVFNNKPN